MSTPTDKVLAGRRRYGGEGEEKPEEKPLAGLGGRRRSRRHTMRVPKGVRVKAKTLKRMLKKAGLKVSGKKATLRSRARKAHLIRGGGEAWGSGPAPVSH